MFQPLGWVFGLFSRDLGIDLGTANTLVYVRGKGIVIAEPSVVAMDTKTKKALAVGAEAKAMIGKTPANIVAIRPLKDGVIADFDGDEIDDAIIQYARRDHNLVIGDRMAENTKIAAGSAYPLDEERRVTLRGRDLLTGLPKSVEVSSVELREAIAGPVNTIVDLIKT